MRILSCIVILLACTFATARAAEPDRRIAVTIDDLPWQRMDSTPPARLRSGHAALMAQLKQAGVPVTGFVNEDKLEVDGVVQPERVAMLRDWLDLGADLGNHTYGHVDAHVVGIPAFEDAIVKGERVLRPMMAERGAAPRWFRHPYLRAGQTDADKQAIVDFLAAHGYRVAPVTVDNGEWVWAFAYERVLDGQPDTPERAALLERLLQAGIRAILVGETLMRSPDIGAKLDELTNTHED